MMRRYGPMHGKFKTLDAELEVKRTTKKAEFTAFVHHWEGYQSYNGSRRHQRNY